MRCLTLILILGLLIGMAIQIATNELILIAVGFLIKVAFHASSVIIE